MILGITGGIGAGKSRVLKILKEEYGAQIIQADEVAKQLEEPGMPGLAALEKLFGDRILDREGCLDKAVFAELIFHDEAALEAVNAVLHPLTWKTIQEMAVREEGVLTVVEAALFDEKSRRLCDKLVFVDTDQETRISRLMEGRGYTREKCLDIMKNQPDRAYFLKLSDIVLDNNGTVEEVRGGIARMMEELNDEIC